MTIFILTALIASLGYIAYLHFRKFKDGLALRKFQSFYDLTKETPPELEVIGTDKSGNKYYAFKHLMQIPAKRETDMQAAIRWAEMCMTPEIFAKKMMELRGFVGKDNNKVLTMIEDLLNRASAAAEEQTLLIVAAQMFLIEGENPKVLTPEFLERKLKLWELDEDAKGFFLHLAYKSLRNFSELSETDLTTYLRDQAIKRTMRKSRLSQVLSEMSQTI